MWQTGYGKLVAVRAATLDHAQSVELRVIVSLPDQTDAVAESYAQQILTAVHSRYRVTTGADRPGPDPAGILTPGPLNLIRRTSAPARLIARGRSLMTTTTAVRDKPRRGDRAESRCRC